MTSYSKEIAEGEMGDSHVGLQARLMSQALRKLSGAVNKSKTIAIFINQIREKIGVMFGNPETTPGGRALKVLANHFGMAPGMYFQQGSKAVVLLPGPPKEMEPMFINELVPLLEQQGSSQQCGQLKSIVSL